MNLYIHFLLDNPLSICRGFLYLQIYNNEPKGAFNMSKSKHKQIKHKRIFYNRARVQKAENINCESCFEPVVFHLRDNCHDFSMGLSTVMECLTFAIEKGYLPKLPMSWLSNADDVCETHYSNNEKLCYYDCESNK